MIIINTKSLHEISPNTYILPSMSANLLQGFSTCCTYAPSDLVDIDVNESNDHSAEEPE